MRGKLVAASWCEACEPHTGTAVGGCYTTVQALFPLRTYTSQRSCWPYFSAKHSQSWWHLNGVSFSCHILVLKYLKGNEEEETCWLCSLWGVGGARRCLTSGQSCVVHEVAPFQGIARNPNPVPLRWVSMGLLIF